jgi:tRNA threonylcarbamoyladenosine biosynthesis protein TsaE
VTRTVELPDPDATAGLAAGIAAALPKEPRGWNILLQGELGSGKSTLARAMLRCLGHSGTVPSPTYTLVEPYDLGQFVAYHIDLYRIADPEELEFLGWSDMNDGLRLIEWPERAPALEELGDLLVSLEYSGEGRRAKLTGLSERGTGLVALLDPDRS